jgi:sigma-B regulation protein RsbU (phosphoserine phosphatase)
MKKLSDCRVLLVDDAKANLDILVEGLKSDHKLSLALNGEMALQAASRSPPDLVLLDIVMPGMDGYEVCRRMRQMPETAEVPIMFLSSLEEVQNKTRGFEAGANDYLTKPFEMLEVKARVKSLLKAKAYSDAVKEQIASELRVAREIQMGMLPHDFSGAEQAYGVKFGAVLEPAREVGGDLYGVCAAGPERLLIFLGDVSGKGIPASMFMVRAISLARLLAREIAEPEIILARLNDELAVDNPSGMFVTFLCAVFEQRSRRLILANAGHCRPVLLPAGEPPRWAVKNLGTALGFEPGLEFERTELTLREGDTLILYSDGVSEAFNPEEECYGDKRLLADAGGFAGQPAPDLTAGLLRKVRAFAGTAPQSDDIAILALKVNGSCRREEAETISRPGPPPHVGGYDQNKPHRLKLELQATPEEVMRGVEALQRFALENGVPEKAIFGLALALEECGSNIVNHAFQRDARQKFQVALEYTGSSFVIELRDRGPEFDPTATVKRKPQADDEDLPGGWGVQLVRRNTDEILYTRQGGENILRLVKWLRPETGGHKLS